MHSIAALRKEMRRNKPEPKRNRTLSLRSETLEKELVNIHELYKETPGSYERFAKFIQTMAITYIYGSKQEISILTQLFGSREGLDYTNDDDDDDDSRAPYAQDWFVNAMSAWRVHYRSDVANRLAEIINCINAVAKLQGAGLEIKPSTIQNAGNGLFASRAFTRGDVVTRYGGYQSTLDVCECLGLDDAYRQYVLEVPGSEHVYDSQIGFTLGGEMGRWINDPQDLLRLNVEFDFAPTGPVIRVIRDIQPGEELFINYGTKFGFIGMCIQCNSNATKVMCEACNVPICGNACHDKHCATHH